jgi:hypothetical protein
MSTQKTPYVDRLAELESLVSDTGLLDDLKARKRIETDKTRLALAAKFAALPDSSRERAASAKDSERATAAFKASHLATQDCERVMKEKQCAHVMMCMACEGEPQRLVNELLRTAPSELNAFLDDIAFAKELLRCAVRIDETNDRNWHGTRVKRVTSNVSVISDARAQLDDARESILDLMKNGTIASTELVKRGEAIMEEALRPLFVFVDQRRWEQRRTISASDLVAEVSGYQ